MEKDIERTRPVLSLHTLAASLDTSNEDILIYFQRRKNLRRRPHVEQEIRGSGVSRIGRQFVFEFSQWYYMHRLIVAFQPDNTLLVTPDAAAVHTATTDSVH